jgi:hypothetical protein
MPIVMTSSQEDHVQGPVNQWLARTAPDAFAKRVQRQGVINKGIEPAEGPADRASSPDASATNSAAYRMWLALSVAARSFTIDGLARS